MFQSEHPDPLPGRGGATPPLPETPLPETPPPDAPPPEATPPEAPPTEAAGRTVLLSWLATFAGLAVIFAVAALLGGRP